MALKDKLNFKFIWGILMIVIYFGMSFLLVFTTLFVGMSLTIRLIFGAIFLIYGIFRAYHIWKNSREL